MHQWPPYETGEQVRKNIDRFADEAEEAYIAVLEEDTQQYRAEDVYKRQVYDWSQRRPVPG